MTLYFHQSHLLAVVEADLHQVEMLADLVVVRHKDQALEVPARQGKVIKVGRHTHHTPRQAIGHLVAVAVLVRLAQTAQVLLAHQVVEQVFLQLLQDRE